MHTGQSVAVNPQDKSIGGGLRVPYIDMFHATLPNMPPDPGGMNTFRAAWAEEAMIAFECEHGEEGEHVRNLAELLRCFQHWSEYNNIRWSDVLEMADTLHRKDTKRRKATK